MSDYISREAAVELLSQPITMSMCLSVEECHHKIAQQRIDRYLVENIPAADVRPVVLCRDCIFRSNEWTGCPKLNGTITGDEFFCKCGIKREES